METKYVGYESFSNMALSNMQEGGWKGPDIKQGHQQDNQFELMEDYLWQTLINLSNDQCAVVQTVWNFNFANSKKDIRQAKNKISSFTVKFGSMP